MRKHLNSLIVTKNRNAHHPLNLIEKRETSFKVRFVFQYSGNSSIFQESDPCERMNLDLS